MREALSWSWQCTLHIFNCNFKAWLPGGLVHKSQKIRKPLKTNYPTLWWSNQKEILKRSMTWTEQKLKDTPFKVQSIAIRIHYIMTWYNSDSKHVKYVTVFLKSLLKFKCCGNIKLGLIIGCIFQKVWVSHEEFVTLFVFPSNLIKAVF